MIKERRSEIRIPFALLPWLWRGNRASDVGGQARAVESGDVSGQLSRSVFLSLAIFRFLTPPMGAGLHVAKELDFPVRLGVLMVSRAAEKCASGGGRGWTIERRP